MVHYIPRITLSDEYARAIGRAVFNFSYLEWLVVWIVERLQPGSVQLYVNGKVTGGKLARQLSEANKAQLRVPHLKEELAAMCRGFDQLVVDRNKLVHAHPYTAPDGEQLLGKSTKSAHFSWSLDELHAFASRCNDFAVKYNKLFHEHLEGL